VVQFVVMAGTFAVIEFVTEIFIASVAHRVSAWLARVGRGFNRACGTIFVAIGALLPLRS
jgi:threonine/homoserine/homoserine lactone efflux protein